MVEKTEKDPFGRAETCASSDALSGGVSPKKTDEIQGCVKDSEDPRRAVFAGFRSDSGKAGGRNAVSEDIPGASPGTSSDTVPLVAIIGPTAVGKTEFSFRLAEDLGAEILSVDSRQVYRYMDVGTDKASSEMRRRIVHHVLDMVDPDEPYSAAEFAAAAGAAITRLRARGRVPLLVGGTPFYYRALLDGILTEDLPRSWEVRRRLEDEAGRVGREALHRRLAELDPPSSARIHPRDLRRVVRALELFELTGRPATETYREGALSAAPYAVLYIGLLRPREELYRRINERVRRQFASGFPEEVAWLLEHGFDESMPALQGFGYRELVAYHRGECTFEEAMNGDAAATRAFSRRQMTWFRKFSPVLWYDASHVLEESSYATILESCGRHLAGYSVKNAGGDPGAVREDV